MSDAAIQDNPARSRYEISVEGELAGFTEYELEGTVIAFTHTEIGESFAGQGLASKLVRFELDEARTRGLAVMPYCPFVRGFMQKHPDYVDLVPQDVRAKFDLPGA
jgi:predicted GNAT family acetyltransferase